MNVILHKIIKTTLSNYIQELKDFEINLFEGEIFLAEGKVDADNLTKIFSSIVPNLVIKSGTVVNLRITIPWTSLSSQSVVINIAELDINIDLLNNLPSLKEVKKKRKLPPIFLTENLDSNHKNLIGTIIKNLKVNIDRANVTINFLDDHKFELIILDIRYGKMNSPNGNLVELAGLDLAHKYKTPIQYVEIVRIKSDSFHFNIESKIGEFIIKFLLSSSLQVYIKAKYMTLIIKSIFFLIESFAFENDLSIITFIKIIEDKKRQLFLILSIEEITLEIELELSNKVMILKANLQNLFFELQHLYPQRRLLIMNDIKSLNAEFDNLKLFAISKANCLDEKSIRKFTKVKIEDELYVNHMLTIEIEPHIENKLIRNSSKFIITGHHFEINLYNLKEKNVDIKIFTEMILDYISKTLPEKIPSPSTVISPTKFKYLSFIDFYIIQNVIDISLSQLASKSKYFY